MNKKYNYKKLIGNKFGRLTMIEIIKSNNRTKAKFKCDCGKIKTISPLSVITGAIVSCGCKKTENLIARWATAEACISYDAMLKETNKGKTDREIAEKFGFNRSTIGLLRRKYKIKTKFSDKKSSNNELFLTQEQKEIILGIILGDGYINKQGNLKVSHSKKQFAYIYWLHHKLSPLTFSLKENIKTNSFSFTTKSLDFLKQLRKELYVNGKKKITKKILEKLTPLSLAVWFMDDGSINESKSNNTLHTEEFAYEDKILIKEYFKKKWDIACEIKKYINKKNIYYNNFFNAENSFKLAQLIKYHLVPSMLYKIREDAKKHVMYLAGGMQSSPDGGVKWRRNLRLQLNKKGYYCIDPTKEEDRILLSKDWKGNIKKDFKKFQKDMRKIIQSDLDFVRMSEFIVCLYDDFVGGGTFHEIGESFLENKKLYIINIDKKPLSELSWWVLGCATEIVDSYSDLLKLLPNVKKQKYIRNNGRVGQKKIKGCV